MDIVNYIGGNIDCALEAEGRISTPYIVVDGLGQGHDVHTRVHEQLCALLRSVAAHDDEAVEIQLIICVLHRGDETVALIVDDVLSRDIPLARGAEDGAALSEDAGKVLGLHIFIVTVDKAAVTVVHTEDLKVLYPVVQSLAYTAHSGVETLTVAA